MQSPHFPPTIRSRGSALLIVLAFLLLLTTLTVAFLSRATMERQLSNASYSQSKTDLVAQGSIATIIADLQQEIVAGSNTGAGSTIPSVAPGYYYPSSPLTAIPAMVVPTTSSSTYTPSGILGTGMENLVKESANSVPFWPSATYYKSTAGPVRASSISTTTASLNNRSVSVGRWNAPLLLALASPSVTSTYTPVTTFVAPTWVYVARDGTNPTTWNTSYEYLPKVAPTTTTSATQGANPVTQRYAYTIYNEGGTLDMNVAGSPMPTTGSYTSAQPYKNALPYADLTQLPYLSTTAQPVATGSSTTLTAAKQQLLINAIVGWRNNYSFWVKNGKLPGSGGTATAYSFTPNTLPTVSPALYPSGSSLAPSDLNIIFNPGGFLSAGGMLGSALQNATGNTYNRTDNAFTSRQQLIQFFTRGLGQNGNFSTSVPLTSLVNVLQYLGTFSRDISQPSYGPPPGRPTVLTSTTGLPNGGNSARGFDTTVNPSLLSVTASATFARNDGTNAVVGEPLIKKRFALNRLAWVTYEGPSADVYAANSSDANLKALMADGIPLSYLQEGTDANIQKYFGLVWKNNVWYYNVHNGSSGTGPTGPIMQLGAVAALATREPDFFEILKGTLTAGSLGKSLSPTGSFVPADSGAPQTQQPYNYNYYAESSVDFQVIQIGANMIAEAQPASYPPQIVFDDGSGSVYVPRTFVGVENLPYLSMVYNGVLVVQKPIPFPRFGLTAYTGDFGSGTSGNSGYMTANNSGDTTTDTLTQCGVGAVMQEPVVWNPYDPSSPVNPAIAPTSFRVVADSTTPDQVLSNGTYNKFFVYGASLGVGEGNNYSYAANSSSPPGPGLNTWYVDSQYGANIGHTFSSANTQIQFNSTGTKELCPEPMVLMRPNNVKDSNGNTITVTVPSTCLMHTDPALSGLFTGGGLPNIAINAPYMEPPETLDAANTPYVGLYMGAFPLSFTVNPTGTQTIPCSSSQSGAFLALVTGTATQGSVSACYMTYRMQYLNATGTWTTYDTKYGQAYSGRNLGGFSSCDASTEAPPLNGTLMAANDYAFVTDPRTSRFGLFYAVYGWTPHNSSGLGDPLPGAEYTFWGSTKTNAAGWLDPANGILYTIRPDSQAGFFTGPTAGSNGSWPSVIGATSGWMANIGSDMSNFNGIQPGLLSQNNTDIFEMIYRFYGDSQGANTFSPNYFADPDGMVRRGMGAFVPLGTLSSPSFFGLAPCADTTVGLPMARVFNWSAAGGASVPTSPDPCITIYPGAPPTSSALTSQAQSRPYFLHRPFATVGELGYVFSDTPWRNLDFFTAESGNTALLDAFCINDTNDPGGLVAGKVDLNTRQSPVLAAVLGAACFDPTAPTVVQIDSTTAGLVAKALVNRTTDTTNVANGTGPLQNLSDLVGRWTANTGNSGNGNYTPINDLGSSLISGTDSGVLPTGSGSGTGFNDGKLSYAGFSGGVWDTGSHAPHANGVEDFTSATGAAKATPNNVPEDVYSAFVSSSTLATNAHHNGMQQTAAYTQRFREAPIRALAAAGTTRVWNLMIDVIAQTGRFPSSANSLASFNVEGERRYWVHVAIDRYTGKVLDEQIEEVTE